MRSMESEVCPIPSRNWADLHFDVLCSILDRLTLLSDYIRFGAVCKAWFLVTEEQKKRRKESVQKEPPLLLIPVVDNREERVLYSVCEGKIYNHRLKIPYRRRCCGSSYGWLAIAEMDSAEKEVSIKLINPFLGNTIHLPSIIKDLERHKHAGDPNYKVEPEFLIRKVILSCDPSLYPNDYVVAAIFDSLSRAVFIRSGETSWNVTHNGFVPVNDILFHRGLLYVVTGRSILAAADYVNFRSSSDRASTSSACNSYSLSRGMSKEDEDIHPHEDKHDQNSEDEEIALNINDREIPNEEEEEEIPNEEKKPSDRPEMWYIVSEFYREHKDWSPKSYLVETSEGDVLLIRRIFSTEEGSNIHHTIDFKVYKLKLDEMYPDNGEGEWVEIQSLDHDDALFLGTNHSICLSASRFPNCKSNCIYYTDDCPMMYQLDPPHEAIDLGVFHLENRSRGNHYILSPSLSYMAPAAWISPVLTTWPWEETAMNVRLSSKVVSRFRRRDLTST